MNIKKRYFVGFSTNDENNKINGWTLTDIELCKRDLLNHFHTIKGERRMMPNFGCAIWDYIMEPLTENNKEAIFYEAKRIVESDTRLSLNQISISEMEHGFVINIHLYFRPWDVYETFSVEFNKRSQNMD